MDALTNRIVGILEGILLVVDSWYGKIYWYMVKEVYQGKYKSTWGHLVSTLFKAPFVLAIDALVNVKVLGIHLISYVSLIGWTAFIFGRGLFLLPYPLNMYLFFACVIGFAYAFINNPIKHSGSRKDGNYSPLPAIAMWTVCIPFVLPFAVLAAVVDFIMHPLQYMEKGINVIFDAMEAPIYKETTLGTILGCIFWGMVALVIYGLMGIRTLEYLDWVAAGGDTSLVPMGYKIMLMVPWVLLVIVLAVVIGINDYAPVFFAALYLGFLGYTTLTIPQELASATSFGATEKYGLILLLALWGGLIYFCVMNYMLNGPHTVTATAISSYVSAYAPVSSSKPSLLSRIPRIQFHPFAWIKKIANAKTTWR